jgi:hypothetical protein
MFGGLVAKTGGAGNRPANHIGPVGGNIKASAVEVPSKSRQKVREPAENILNSELK